MRRFSIVVTLVCGLTCLSIGANAAPGREGKKPGEGRDQKETEQRREKGAEAREQSQSSNLAAELGAKAIGLLPGYAGSRLQEVILKARLWTVQSAELSNRKTGTNVLSNAELAQRLVAGMERLDKAGQRDGEQWKLAEIGMRAMLMAGRREDSSKETPIAEEAFARDLLSLVQHVETSAPKEGLTSAVDFWTKFTAHAEKAPETVGTIYTAAVNEHYRPQGRDLTMKEIQEQLERIRSCKE